MKRRRGSTCQNTVWILGLLFVISRAASAATTLSLQVSADGSYTIAWPNGTVWLSSAPPFFTINNVTHSANSTLTLLGVNQTTHPTEGYVSNDIYYSANGTLIVASIHDYIATNLLTFSVTFPQGGNRTAVTSADDVTCGFPGFRVDPAPARLAYMSYGDSLQRPAVGRWQNDTVLLYRGRLGSGPLVLFDKNNSAMVMGPSSAFSSASLWQDHQKSAVYWGIMGSVTSVPANFTYSVLLIASEGGIGQAVSVWSLALASNYTKTTAEAGVLPDPPSSSVFQTIGYWTSAGSEYYTSPEVGKTYEETLVDVRRDANNETGNWVPRLAYRYGELDQWWYQKSQAGDAVKTWAADTSKLPNGITGIVNKTDQWELVAASGVWSNDTTYAVQNGGPYAFVMGDACALPAVEVFWGDLFRKVVADGVTAYLQYDMDKQFQCMTSANADEELLQKWLSQLTSGATMAGVEVMYGPTIPRVLLQTSVVLRQPAVVQVGSGNVSNANHWKVGVANIYVDALGLRPYFGAIKSYRTESDPDTQLSPELYSLLATLTGGAVAIGDRVGHSNRTVISRCCDNVRGLVLSPSHPARAIDAQLQQMAWGEGGVTGEVWTTFTANKLNSDNNNFFHGIIMATGMTSDFDLTPTAAGLKFVQAGPEPVYQPTKIFAFHDQETMYDFTDSSPITLRNCTLQNFCLYHAAPVFKFRDKEVVILGDASKWVPMSPQRIVRVDTTEVAITVTVRGEPYEEVYIWFMVNGRLEAIAQRINDDGKAIVKYEESPDHSGCDRKSSFNILSFSVAVFFLIKYHRLF